MTLTPSNVACVWGANGISGTAMIDLLVEQPRNEWSKIICISRRPTQLDVEDDRVHFISIDILQANVDEIVTELSKAGGESITHVYHYTYIEKKDEKELDQVNTILFQKALDATVKIAGKQIKCVLLQTGYKYYGVHKGGEYLASCPYTEDAPRHKGSNFYYIQEDLLKEYAEKNGWKYIITRPNIIIGVSRGNFMNFAVSLALYACIQKEKSQPLYFPGNEIAWNSIVDHSDALNNARFQLWSSTNDKIQNEIFNIHNGDEVKFRTLWPKIEKYFDFTPYKQKFNTQNDIKIGDIGILRLSLAKYMPENKDIWSRLAKRNELDESAFNYATWEFIDFVLGRTFDDHGDMTKARQYGWTTTVDTSECFIQCFDRLKKMEVIPFN
ncbi:unnamed protein product [Rotaria sp. Silwood1]|nr:unnamed protein product [Rotaria sp. Silwood1]CAF4525301.1 unnamed protein product [Rotaria sp. Silwood1]